MTAVAAISDSTFEAEVIESPVPVLVDFWAPWCGPCRLISPIVDAVAAEYGDQLKVVKINVDEHTQMASQFNVRGIPALMIFKDGQELETLVGAVTKETLTGALAKFL